MTKHKNTDVLTEYELKGLHLSLSSPTMKDIVGSDLMDKFETKVKDLMDRKGSVDGINSEVDFGIIGTITNHVIYNNGRFKTFGASKAAIILARIAIEIMQIAKSKGVDLKLGYSSYMPINEPCKFDWVLAHPEKLITVKFTELGKQVDKNIKAAGARYPGYGIDVATIVQPDD